MKRSVVQRVTGLTVEYLRQDGGHWTDDRHDAGDWPDHEAVALARQNHAIAAPCGSCTRKPAATPLTPSLFIQLSNPN